MATELFPSLQVEETKQKMSSFLGEAVLVISRIWEQSGWDMPVYMIPYSFQERLFLGIITPPFLNEDNNYGLKILTPQHAISKVWWRRDKISTETGPINDWRIYSYLLNKKLGPPRSKGESFGCFPRGERKNKDEDKLALEIIAGDQEVTSWFVYDAQYGRMDDYEKEYLKNVEKRTTSEKVNSEYIQHIKETNLNLNVLIGYQKMRAALGLTAVVLPVDLEEKINLQISKSKLEAVENIEKLIMEGKMLQDGQGGLRKAVEEAMKLGLHLKPWVIAREIVPGKKVEIDVPVFINNLAQHFEISLVDKK
ncbi:MAG: hypothetical protein Q7R43_01450 [Candidatus Daviesbacteria bacterium]|nr:hypothetical protein [Candidatus Daviesbacteria bacterium]